jgi:catechol 2,3-dioxygenase-like lactoylglutathione lyase family enzyme
MDWYVHHVNIPSHNVPESARFYEQAAGMQQCEWVYPDPERQNHGASDTLAGMGEYNRGVHIVTQRPMFAHDNGFMLNPTIGGHFAICVSDLDQVKANLDRAGITYDDAGIYAMADMHQIYVLDPAMNLVEVNQNKGGRAGPAPAPGEEHGRVMQPGGWYLHHVNIAAPNVRETTAFYVDMLGMQEKALSMPETTGNFRFDPEALTVFGSENRGLHIIRPVTSWGRDNGLKHNPSIGGHFAVCVPDMAKTMAALDEMGVPYSDAGTIAMAGMRQIFCYDPGMNLVEFNAHI